MPEELPTQFVRLDRIAATLKAGKRTARDVCSQHGALNKDGTVDYAKLFDALGLPITCRKAFDANMCVFMTVRELADRYGITTLTLRNHAKNNTHAYPQPITLTPRLRLFIRQDIEAHEYGLPPTWYHAANEDGAFGQKDERLEISAHLAGFPDDIDALIPPAPVQKPKRKK